MYAVGGGHPGLLIAADATWAGRYDAAHCSCERCGCGAVCPDIVVAVDATWGAKAAGTASVVAGTTGHVSAPFTLKEAGNAAASTASKLVEAYTGSLASSSSLTAGEECMPSAAGALTASLAADPVWAGQRDAALHGCGRCGCSAVRPNIAAAVDVT
jgi:hypothetical protein